MNAEGRIKGPVAGPPSSLLRSYDAAGSFWVLGRFPDMTVIVYNGGTMIPALCIVVIFFVVLGYFRRRFSNGLPKTESWKSLPKTAEDWIHLVLIPVKTYAAAAYPFLTVSLRLVSRFSLLNDDAPLTAPLVSHGYLIAVSVLFLGALTQIVVCRFCHVIETLSFVLLGIAFWWMTGQIYFMGR